MLCHAVRQRMLRGGWRAVRDRCIGTVGLRVDALSRHRRGEPVGVRKGPAHGTVTSTSFAFLCNFNGLGANHRASASRAFCTASASVSPALPQPGSSGKTADHRFASGSNSTSRLIKPRDRADAAFARANAIPKVGHFAAQRSDHANAGDNYSSIHPGTLPLARIGRKNAPASQSLRPCPRFMPDQ